MYIPSWPPLDPGLCLGPSRPGSPPFPLSAPRKRFTYVARGAIFQLLRSLSVGAEDLILMPDYHHGNEVAAVRATGARISLYPINSRMEPDEATLRKLLSYRPRALVLIHYFGWPQPVGRIAALCRERGVLLIEDCALAMLSESTEGPVGSHGDYAVFCLYKTLAVPNGAVLVANGHSHGLLPEEVDRRCGLPSLTGRTLELLLEWIRTRWDRGGALLHEAKRRGGRVLSDLGIARMPVGDTGFDLARAHTAMSALTGHLLRRFDYRQIVRSRRRNYLALRERLEGHVPFLDQDLGPGVCPLFFPLLVREKGAAVRRLRDCGIGAIEFWNQGAPGTASMGPTSAFLRQHLVEIPIHQDVTPAAIEHMAARIRQMGSWEL